MKIIDLTRTISNEQPGYPNDPLVELDKIYTIVKEGYNLTKITMGTHTGSHVDLPYHFIEKGSDAESMRLESFFGKGIVICVHIGKNPMIDDKDIDLSKVERGDILVIDTEWGKEKSGEGYYFGYPCISVGLAKKLVDIGIKALATDLPSVDNDGSTHKILLSNEIVIFENLINLGELVGSEFEFFGVPLKIEKGDGSPVRAFALLERE